MPKLVLYEVEPVRIEGQLLYEHKYSDRLIVKLLEAGDPDRFNRQRAAPLEGDLDNLTEGQIRALLEWLRVQIQIAESRHGQEPKQLAEPTVEATPVSEPPSSLSPKRSFRPTGGDGWPIRWRRDEAVGPGESDYVLGHPKASEIWRNRCIFE